MQEYYEKLCKKFPEITFNTGSSLMSGNENKVVINLSSECLKKMANDPEFAKKVEFNLTGAVPGQNRMFAQAKADNAVIHGVTTVIDADGNASVTCGGMTRTSGSKQNSTILNAEKKQKERQRIASDIDSLFSFYSPLIYFPGSTGSSFSFIEKCRCSAPLASKVDVLPTFPMTSPRETTSPSSTRPSSARFP